MKRLRTFFVKYKKETALLGALLFLSVISFIILNLSAPEGAYAEVRINGECVAVYPLSQDGEYPLNGGTNILVIEDGTAYLSYASCPDKTCVKTGRLHRTGESAVCLPNKLSVTIRGADDGPELVPGSPPE